MSVIRREDRRFAEVRWSLRELEDVGRERVGEWGLGRGEWGAGNGECQLAAPALLGVLGVESLSALVIGSLQPGSHAFQTSLLQPPEEQAADGHIEHETADPGHRGTSIRKHMEERHDGTPTQSGPEPLPRGRIAQLFISRQFVRDIRIDIRVPHVIRYNPNPTTTATPVAI